MLTNLQYKYKIQNLKIIMVLIISDIIKNYLFKNYLISITYFMYNILIT